MTDIKIINDSPPESPNVELVTYFLYNKESGEVQTTTSSSKLVQDVIIELLTKLGSSKCYPNNGCNFVTNLIGVSNNLENQIPLIIAEPLITVTENIVRRTKNNTDPATRLNLLYLIEAATENDTATIKIGIQSDDNTINQAYIQIT